MAAPEAATLQAIRQEAGLQHQKKAEVLAGTVDGSNKIFVTARTYVVDRNADDVLNASDVVVYVNNLPVTVSSVDGSSGAITLDTAPENGTSIKGDYAYSVLSDAEATQIRKEATGWLKTKVKSYVNYDDYTTETYPPEFSTIVKLYAAGLLLIRDYGSSADTELSSKDGYEKIKLAKSMLAEWLGDTTDDSDTAAPTTGSMLTDGNVFTRDRHLGNGHDSLLPPDTDEFFHHDDRLHRYG